MHGWVSMVRGLSCKPNIYVSWSTSKLRVRLAQWNWFKPSSKDIFTDSSKAVLLLWVNFAINVSCLSCCLVCLLLPSCHLLGKGWHLGSRLRCFIVFCHFPMLYAMSGVVLDCIDSWSLPPFRTLWQVTVVLAAWSLHASWELNIFVLHQQQNLERRFGTSKMHLSPPPPLDLGCCPF